MIFLNNKVRNPSNKTFSVYFILDPISLIPRYIGISCVPENRFRRHLRDKSESYKARWIRKLLGCGLKPVFKIIKMGLTRDKAAEIEINTICRYRHLGYNLTNITDGGEGFRGKHSIKSRLLMSRSKKGKSSHNKGKKFSKELCHKLSRVHLGLPSGMKGKHHKLETCQRISMKLKGRPSPKKGNHLSIKHRKNLSRSHMGLPSGMKGKHHTVATKLKISESLKGRGKWI